VSVLDPQAQEQVANHNIDEAAQRLLRGELPLATSHRWQPLRVGLMNLFLFEDERFLFYGGRLLLRGSNGTGKSRVLAMTLPLLLDGSLHPTRVEPDRDATRQVNWNVLGDEQKSATGYTWLELGRRDDEGEHFLTLGMGIRAVRDGAMKSWFFLTPLRIDRDLALKTSDGVPLTPRALEEALQSRGQVIDTATEYRRAVDEQLFRLGDRYEPLIDLLLQLRQPKLAEKLDIDQMEAALRSSLPPLSQALLDDAAEAFRDLDEYRTSLAEDQQLLANVQRFMRPYRNHICRGVLRAIKALTGANSRYESAQRKLRQLADEQLQQQRRKEELQRDKQALQVALTAGQAAIEELQRSPEMRSVERLDELRQSAAKSQQRLDEAEQHLAQVVRQLAAAEQQSRRAAQAAEAAHTAAVEASAAARTVAAPEALQNRHREWLGPPLDHGDLDAYQAAEAKLRKEAARWQQSAERLAQWSLRVEASRRRLADSTRRVEEAHAQHRNCEERLAGAVTAFADEREAIWNAIRAWHASATPLHFALPPLTQWYDAWQSWAEGLGDEAASRRNPSDDYLQAASGHAHRRLAAEQASARSCLEELARQRDALERERQRLQSGQVIAPPPRAERDLSHRATIAGAPLWRLLEFQASVPAAERAGWEAALEDSGLLDAWVTRDGRLLSEDSAGEARFDVQLISGELPILAENRQLARVVAVESRACEDAGIPLEVMQRLLAVIGVGAGAGQTWVAADGRWQNGPLAGRWMKAQPQYVGEEVRAQHRAARLEQLARELVGLDEELAQQQRLLESIAAREREVDELRSAFPSSQSVTEASLRVVAAAGDVDAAQVRVDERIKAEQTQRAEVDGLVEGRLAEATDFGLVAWAERGEELRRRLESYVEKLQTLSARFEGYHAAQVSQCHAADALEGLAAQHRATSQSSQALKAEQAAETRRLEELERTLGKDADSIIQRLTEKRQQHQQDSAALEANGQAILAAQGSLSITENNIQHGEAEANGLDEMRRTAAEWFSFLHERGLLALAELTTEAAEIPELPWAMTTSLRVARQLDAILSDLAHDDDAWNRSRDQLFTAQNELRGAVLTQHEFSIAADNLSDGLQIVTLSLQGELLPPDVVVGKLDAEIESRKRILDEREQEMLEKYLLGEVAEGMRVRMRTAAGLVETMTAEVSQRPMTTGMQMRFKWLQAEEGPPGLAEACEVLSTASATWSPEEREQIKRFLQQSIRLQRESEQTESWPEHLAAALDYRLWHRIAIERRSGPEAHWKRLTRRTYGSGSGGEKAIALTLPQLAAVAAYYESADPRAPRFVLLDEAFAGVSSDGREACMELIEAFKLDVVMTSETEWGMYPGVRQLAICQLDRFPEFNAVVNRLFLWNGRDLREAISGEEAREAAAQPLFANGDETSHADA
jgi:uncharacterized protein (TIGR02680 family)